jgi:hypothetical protein
MLESNPYSSVDDLGKFMLTKKYKRKKPYPFKISIVFFRKTKKEKMLLKDT